MIRVGRVKYTNVADFPDYKPITVMTASSEYASLSPYLLKNDKGQIMENLWQFSKLYINVPKTTCNYSRWNKIVTWDHPAETHIIDSQCTPEFANWRNKGYNCGYAIRYPVGFHHRHNCVGSFYGGDDLGKCSGILNYIDSRKELYVPLYHKLVIQQRQFTELRELLDNDVNLLILEVDGPHQDSLHYYQNKYNVGNDFIIDDTVIVTKENMKILINDKKHPFGHGYCLGASLLGIQEEIVE